MIFSYFGNVWLCSSLFVDSALCSSSVDFLPRLAAYTVSTSGWNHRPPRKSLTPLNLVPLHSIGSARFSNRDVTHPNLPSPLKCLFLFRNETHFCKTQTTGTHRYEVKGGKNRIQNNHLFTPCAINQTLRDLDSRQAAVAREVIYSCSFVAIITLHPSIYGLKERRRKTIKPFLPAFYSGRIRWTKR